MEKKRQTISIYNNLLVVKPQSESTKETKTNSSYIHLPRPAVDKTLLQMNVKDDASIFNTNSVGSAEESKQGKGGRYGGRFGAYQGEAEAHEEEQALEHNDTISV